MEARCQGFSVSDGTAGWQTSARGAPEEIRVAGRRREEVGVAVTSKSVLCSAGVLGYVTVILS